MNILGYEGAKLERIYWKLILQWLSWREKLIVIQLKGV